MGYDENHKRIYKSVTGSTYSEVESKIALLKVSKADTRPKILFKDAREQYIESSKPVLSPATIRGYKQMGTYFGKLDGYALNNIDKYVMQDWVNEFLQTHSPKTVRNAYGLARKVLSEYGYEVTAKLPPKEPKTIFVPSNEQVQTIIKWFQDVNDMDMVRAISLAAFGTLRRSEICGLQAEDVKGNIVHIHSAIVVDEDNNKITKGTKTFGSDRYIELPQFVIDLLPNAGPVVNISPDVITSRFERGLKYANLPSFRFHSLRAYSASFMHSIGIPDFSIMERGGWTSQDTLNRIYRGTVPEYKQTFINKTNSQIENLFGDLF